MAHPSSHQDAHGDSHHDVSSELEVARNMLRLRLSQMIINEMYKKGDFKVPIHLALGHEAIAVAMDAIMQPADSLVLSHRNIHYNLARIRDLKPEIDEYLLEDNGIAAAKLGSMNLSNPKHGLVYTSSILGNNLSVGAGIALAKKVKQENGLTIVVIGDGAMEEGSFYEGLEFLKSNELPAIYIVENNEWSLATRIHERRCYIDVEKLAASFGLGYARLDSNDVFEYIKYLKHIREKSIEAKTVYVVEVMLTTLGHWMLKIQDPPGEKFINYHAGPAPTINLIEWPIIEEANTDPIFILKKHIDEEKLKQLSSKVLEFLRDNIK